MNTVALVLCVSLELVGDGQAQVRLEADDSKAAQHAARLIREHVVLMTGVALPTLGEAHALRFELSPYRGYRIEPDEGGTRWLVRGDDLVRAAYDLLALWGCRFDVAPPHIPRHKRLALKARTVKRARDLFIEGPFDPTWGAQGWSVVGLAQYDAPRAQRLRALGYRVFVASVSFDDFLDPTLFKKHPEWFARRGKTRVPRGNFALTNPDARTAYLNTLGQWLEKHPHIDRVGIWPEVTTVWDEDALDAGAPESYALLWRAAATRFPKRRFEILATGLTLHPPRTGRVPKNVVVRLRPGAEASAWQPLLGQEIFAVVRGWRARGARILLEIDGAPPSWCGLPWPSHNAVRGNAAQFDQAVLVRGHRNLAALWRAPEEPVALGPRLARLLERARSISCAGELLGAGALFTKPDDGVGFLVGKVERLLRVASDTTQPEAARRDAAREMYLAYRQARRQIPDSSRYRRYRDRTVRRLVDQLAPDGIRYQVGPAIVVERAAQVEIETDRLALHIDRASATVIGARRKVGATWSPWIGPENTALFAVAALTQATDRVDGRIEITSPKTGVVHIELGGKFGHGGASWRNQLTFRNASGTIRQTASTTARGGLVVGSRFAQNRFDYWVCPAHAAEGTMENPLPSLGLPPGTLVYCRKGNRGLGLALRLENGGLVRLQSQDGQTLFYTTTRQDTQKVTWILFESQAELGR